MTAAVRDLAARVRAVRIPRAKTSHQERARGRAGRRRPGDRGRGLPTSRLGAGPTKTPTKARQLPTSGTLDSRSRAASPGASSPAGAAVQAVRSGARVRTSGRPSGVPTSASGPRNTARGLGGAARRGRGADRRSPSGRGGVRRPGVPRSACSSRPQRRQALERIVLHATTLRIPIVEVEGGSLTALAGLRRPPGRRRRRRGRGSSPASTTSSPARSSAASRRSCSCSTRSRIPRTSARCSGAPRRPASTGWSSRPQRQAPPQPRRDQGVRGGHRAPPALPGRRPAPVRLTDLHLRGLRIVGSEAEAALSAREADLRGPDRDRRRQRGPRPCARPSGAAATCSSGSRCAARSARSTRPSPGSILLFEALGQRDPDARPAGRRRGSSAGADRGDRRPAPRRTLAAGASREAAPTATRREPGDRSPRSDPEPAAATPSRRSEADGGEGREGCRSTSTAAKRTATEPRGEAGREEGARGPTSRRPEGPLPASRPDARERPDRRRRPAARRPGPSA